MERFKATLLVIAWTVFVIALMGAMTWHTHRFAGVVGGVVVMAVIIVVWLWNRRSRDV